jgi:hypothetical protein
MDYGFKRIKGLKVEIEIEIEIEVEVERLRD